jgi:putative DNA primase/helicase
MSEDKRHDGSDAIKAEHVKPEKVKWLWHKRIPQGFITVVAGKPDQGKGLFSAFVAAEVSRKGGNVLYSAIEDDLARMTRPRLEAAGADLSRVLLWRFALPTQLDELTAHVIDNEIRLIVIDPFAAHLDGVSRHADSIRKVLTPLSKLAERTGAAVLVTEHALKRVAANGDPLNAIGGSGSGLPAAARMAYLFGTDPKDHDRRILAAVKSNLRERPKSLAFEADVDEFEIVGEVPSLVKTGEVEFSARRLLEKSEDGAGGSKRGPNPVKRTAVTEWLIRYLFDAGKPVPSGLVLSDAKDAGWTAKTTRNAAGDVPVVKTPPGGGPKTTWALPDELRDLIEDTMPLVPGNGDDDDKGGDSS